MVSSFTGNAAVVAVVDELISTLSVKLVQHGHGRELGTSQRRELPVSLSSHGEESISAVHQITRYEAIRIGGARQGGGDRHGLVEEDREEHVFVLLHRLVHFVRQLISRQHHAPLLAGLVPCAVGLLASFVPFVCFLRCPTLSEKRRKKF